MLNHLRKAMSYDNPLRRTWHWLRGTMAAYIWRFPAKKLVVIGVTGTNGKTTTTHIIEHLLRSSGKRVAMVSTATLSINGKSKANPSKKTTLSPFATQKFLRKCRQEKIDYVVLESSSHALHQYRLWGIVFAIGVLTNITHEHLDYHKTLEKYAEAKRLLFKNVEKGCHRKCRSKVKHHHAAVINAGTRFFNKFVQGDFSEKIIYGINQGDLQAKNVTEEKSGETFCIRYKREQVPVKLPLLGDFNIENSLAAVGAAMACDVSLEEASKALGSFEGVAGRLERIKSPKGFEVVVDFALTPDAPDRLYQVIKKMATHRIIGIIGSCGDRDKKKRPDMGKVVAEHSDITIVTDEEPYSEDPRAIMEAVLEGAKKVKTLDKDLHLVEDRKKAIEFAIKKAEKGDVIVLTGMGSFTTRNMNEGLMEWDDRKITKELIEKN